MFRFTIRDVLWLTVVVAIGVAWWLENRGSQPLRFTGQPFDIAISGEGYFQLSDPQSGSALYSRLGSLSIGDSSQLILKSSGTEFPICPGIQIPMDATAVAISSSGMVMVQVPGETELRCMGQLQLAVFPKPDKLKKIAPAVYAWTVESGEPCLSVPGNEGIGTVIQGALQKSL